MVSEQEAIRTLEVNQDVLLDKHADLMYLAVVSRELIGEKAEPVNDYYIEAGVTDVNLQLACQSQKKVQFAKSYHALPRNLKVPNNEKNGFLEKSVELALSESTRFDQLCSTNNQQIPIVNRNYYGHEGKFRPLTGGIPIRTEKYLNDAPGTLGAAIRLKNDQYIYLLSNWHVLCKELGRLGDKIYQPGVSSAGGMNSQIIGELFWMRLNSKCDAALARVTDPSIIVGGTLDYSRIGDVVKPQIDMVVKKCGRTTQKTFGKIRSVNCTAKVWGYPPNSSLPTKFYSQLLTTHMTLKGDSGSVVVEHLTNDALGLLFASNNQTYSLCNSLIEVFNNTLDPAVFEHVDQTIETLPCFAFDNFL